MMNIPDYPNLVGVVNTYLERLEDVARDFKSSDLLEYIRAAMGVDLAIGMETVVGVFDLINSVNTYTANSRCNIDPDYPTLVGVVKTYLESLEDEDFNSEYLLDDVRDAMGKNLKIDTQMITNVFNLIKSVNAHKTYLEDNN